MWIHDPENGGTGLNHKDKAYKKLEIHPNKNISCFNTDERCLRGHRIHECIENETAESAGNPRTGKIENCYKLEFLCPITEKQILGAVVFNDEVDE
jgi:hypothetical protein